MAFGIFFGMGIGMAVGIVIGIVVGIVVGIARGIAVGMARGMAREIAIGMARGMARGIAIGMAVGITFGITLGIAFGMASGIAYGNGSDASLESPVIIASLIAVGIASGIAFGLAVGIDRGTAVGIAGGPAVGIAGGSSVGTAVGIGFGMAVGIAFEIEREIYEDIFHGIIAGIIVGLIVRIASTRYYYNILVWFSGWFFKHFRLYHVHPAAWDDMCAIPFLNLHQLLMAEWTRDATKGKQEIERILNYPSQRVEGLKAFTIMILRELSDSPLLELGKLAVSLPVGEKGYLKQIPHVRQQCVEISRQAQLLASANRAYMRTSHFELLVEKINSFKHQFRGFEYPLALECEKAAETWLAAAEQLRPPSTRRQETVPGVFRVGDPVDAGSEAFVHRLKVFGNLERQLTLATGCPGLVLYGRRRVGKSTLLRNLPQFLPDHYITLNLSMQDPKFFIDLASFVRSLREEALRQCPSDMAQLPPDQPETLPGLIQSLATWNKQLGDKRRLLLCLDEYEMIDHKMAEGIFTENLLDAIRQSVQTHRRITWLFAGSHRIEELGAADWTSRLVSAMTLTLGCFTLEETQLLLNDPLGRSHLWSQRKDKPDFSNFWAEGHIEQIQAETGGWPHLVQLLAQTLVDLANDRGQTQTDAKLFDEALEEAADSGHNVFYQLLIRESSPAQQAYLRGFANQKTQPIPTNPELNKSLIHSDLIIQTESGYELKAPIMAKWLKKHPA